MSKPSSAGPGPAAPREPTIAESILAQLSSMRTGESFADGTSLCWNPAELELLAMFAISCKNELAALHARQTEWHEALEAATDRVVELEREADALRAQPDTKRLDWLEAQGQLSIYFIERPGKQFNPASQALRPAIDHELELDDSWRQWKSKSSDSETTNGR